ncbi:hypothetical protein [Rhizobium rhizogenes]|uniref:hypothetical protein n=1 Tax=Rhizobium rhizogenes TaxID=359 RepID=UPI0015749CA8|nr:hypothetical protein [Rhizobium rhizogenes]
MQTLSSITPLQRLCFLSHLTPAHGASQKDDLIARLSPLAGINVATVQDTICESAVAARILSLISTMRALDWAFEHDLNYKKHAYILGDKTLAALPGVKSDTEDAPQRDTLELMGTIGLIYRFNVAPKFGIPDPGTMQLRLNGWGREVFKIFNCADSPAYKLALTYISSRIEEHRGLYEELLTLCNSDERPLATQRISELLEQVPIKVVT